MRLPHNAIRDWWHQPVTDRLDRIEAALVKTHVELHPQPKVDAEVREALDRLSSYSLRARDKVKKPWS